MNKLKPPIHNQTTKHHRLLKQWFFCTHPSSYKYDSEMSFHRTEIQYVMNSSSTKAHLLVKSFMNQYTLFKKHIGLLLSSPYLHAGNLHA